MNNYLTDSSTRTSTAGGTLLVLLMQVNAAQLFNTAITAATGAMVSFIVAVACRYTSHWLMLKLKKKRIKKIKSGKPD